MLPPRSESKRKTDLLTNLYGVPSSMRKADIPVGTGARYMTPSSLLSSRSVSRRPGQPLEETKGSLSTQDFPGQGEAKIPATLPTLLGRRRQPLDFFDVPGEEEKILPRSGRRETERSQESEIEKQKELVERKSAFSPLIPLTVPPPPTEASALFRRSIRDHLSLEVAAERWEQSLSLPQSQLFLALQSSDWVPATTTTSSSLEEIVTKESSFYSILETMKEVRENAQISPVVLDDVNGRTSIPYEWNVSFPSSRLLGPTVQAADSYPRRPLEHLFEIQTVLHFYEDEKDQKTTEAKMISQLKRHAARTEQCIIESLETHLSPVFAEQSLFPIFRPSTTPEEGGGSSSSAFDDRHPRLIFHIHVAQKDELVPDSKRTESEGSPLGWTSASALLIPKVWPGDEAASYLSHASHTEGVKEVGYLSEVLGQAQQAEDRIRDEMMRVAKAREEMWLATGFFDFRAWRLRVQWSPISAALMRSILDAETDRARRLTQQHNDFLSSSNPNRPHLQMAAYYSSTIRSYSKLRRACETCFSDAVTQCNLGFVCVPNDELSRTLEESTSSSSLTRRIRVPGSDQDADFIEYVAALTSTCPYPTVIVLFLHEDDLIAPKGPNGPGREGRYEGYREWLDYLHGPRLNGVSILPVVCPMAWGNKKSLLEDPVGEFYLRDAFWSPKEVTDMLASSDVWTLPTRRNGENRWYEQLSMLTHGKLFVPTALILACSMTAPCQPVFLSRNAIATQCACVVFHHAAQGAYDRFRIPKAHQFFLQKRDWPTVIVRLWSDQEVVTEPGEVDIIEQFLSNIEDKRPILLSYTGWEKSSGTRSLSLPTSGAQVRKFVHLHFLPAKLESIELSKGNQVHLSVNELFNQAASRWANQEKLVMEAVTELLKSGIPTGSELGSPSVFSPDDLKQTNALESKDGRSLVFLSGAITERPFVLQGTLSYYWEQALEQAKRYHPWLDIEEKKESRTISNPLQEEIDFTPEAFSSLFSSPLPGPTTQETDFQETEEHET